MEIAQSLLNEAQKILQYEGETSLPQQLGDTKFFLAKAEDSSVFGFGVIKFNGVEYKIGAEKTK
jgi:hypothetical protein